MNYITEKNEKTKIENVIHSELQLQEYLQLKAQNHHCYKTYKQRNHVESWMEERSIFLSDGRNWNDTFDRQAFNNEGSEVKNFGLCFSFSRSESVAMWMLYGGREGDGVMIDFKQKHIKRILTKTEYVDLGKWENGKFTTVKRLPKSKFQLKIVDVLYYTRDKENDGLYNIKRADETFKEAKKSVIDELACVKKTYPWNYENECRMILSVNKEDLPDNNLHTVRISVGEMFLELFKEGRIYHSPINKKELKYSLSSLHSEIDWDLCYGCKHR